jgi:hypothetical protein
MVPNPRRRLARSLLDGFVLSALVGMLLVWPLLGTPIGHHGEAREGLVVQDVVAGDHWILPRRNGELPSKPPLFHWIGAGAVAAFGWSDAAVRVPSALAAWGACWLTLVLGTAVAGRAVGWVSVGVLLGMVPLLRAATEARVDMVFAACVAGALVAFHEWYRTRSRVARALVYAAGAAAVLAKGLAGAALPALVILAFLSVQRELRLVRELWSWPLLAAAAAIDVGWYALATLDGGWKFVELQLLRENVSRFVGGAEFRRQGRGATLRLPRALVTNFLPWSLALVWCGVLWWRGVRASASERYLHVWWMTVVLFFTLGAGKRSVYLLPACPALAVLAGSVLAGAAPRPAFLDRALAMLPGPRGGEGRSRPIVWRVLAVVLVFDVTAVTVLHVVHRGRGQRRSLAPFLDAINACVAPDAAIGADPMLAPTDRMVLAYGLRRPVAWRTEAAPPGSLTLVPEAQVLARWQAGDRLLLESHRRRTNVALMTTAAMPGRGDVTEHPATVSGRDRARVLVPLENHACFGNGSGRKH